MAWQSKYYNMGINKGNINNGVVIKVCLIWILTRAIYSMALSNIDINRGNINNGVVIKVCLIWILIRAKFSMA